MKNIIVYGSRFGQFYLEALKRMKGIKIVGLLAKGSDRSYECARYYNIPLYTSLDEVEERVDVACVAVKTGALGGEGANIAKQLLRKGINVLLEQPVHYKELGECYKIAQNQKVYFGVGNLYLNLPAVQNFIRNVHIVSKTEKIAYINVDLATQVSYPVISILGEVLQTLRPWENVGSICGHVPFQTETVKIGDIPISFRAHNEIEKENIDGFLHMLFRISVGFAGGQLTLFDPDGPVIWNPRIHFPDENIIPGRLEFHSPLNMDEQNSFILYSSEKKQKMIFKDEWPCAIAKDIEKTVVEPTEPTIQYIQRILNNSHAWQLLMKGLGYPEIVSGSFYSYYPSEKLLRESTSLFEKSSALLGGMAVFNNMCLKTMYYYLQQNIKEVNKGYTSDELIERIGVKADFVPIIHRWLHVLNSNSYIRNEEKEYYFEKKMHYSELEKIWVDGKNVWENANLGTISTYEYFKNNALKLNYIMKGELNPTLLLFPEGQMYVADDLYSKTPISSYYNQMISDYVKSECELREGCRLLELGGGTASTAKPIIEKIKFLSVEEYFFSDISDFFVNRAKELFSGIRFIEYLKIDINNDFVSDKIKEDSVDIVIAVSIVGTRIVRECIKQGNDYIDPFGEGDVEKYIVDNKSMIGDKKTRIILSSGTYPGLSEALFKYVAEIHKGAEVSIKEYFYGNSYFSHGATQDVISSMINNKSKSMSFFYKDEIIPCKMRIGESICIDEKVGTMYLYPIISKDFRRVCKETGVKEGCFFNTFSDLSSMASFFEIGSKIYHSNSMDTFGYTEQLEKMYRNKSTENEKTIFWFGIELVNGNDVEKKLMSFEYACNWNSLSGYVCALVAEWCLNDEISKGKAYNLDEIEGIQKFIESLPGEIKQNIVKL